jgi:hypothetical protein
MIAASRLALVIILTLSLGIVPARAGADAESGAGEDRLSPYWGDAISQWSQWIVYWANERELDPDLVAAVVRKESIGHAAAEGPGGAVGLMMVMPAEASGLPWRPNAEELKQPSMNLRWGTGMLSEIIRESGGDLLHALAAYNGGWEQVHLPVTRRYAQSVLTYYAYAMAGRHGYSYKEGKVWTLVIMTRVDGHINLIQTSTSGQFLAPCFEGAVEFRDLYPEMVNAPRTRVAHYTDEEGHDVLIDAWLFVGPPDSPPDETVISTAPLTIPGIGQRP